MDKEKIKNFIVTQRQNGVPDDQIYSFLQEKGAIAKPQAPEVAKETTAEKIAGFTGGKELAQGIGQALAQKEISAGIQDTMNQQIEIQGKLVKKLQEEKAAGLDTSKTEQALKYITDDLAKTSGSVEQQLNPNALTPGQVIGSSLQLGTTLAGVGSYSKAGLVGENAITTGLQRTVPTVASQATKGVGIAQGVAQGAKTGAISGAAYGGASGIAEGISEGKSAGEVIQEGIGGALVGAGTGALLGGAIGGVSGGIKQVRATRGTKETNFAQELVSPKATSEVKQQALREGRVTEQGLLSAGKITPSKRDMEVAEAVKDVVSRKRTPIQNMNAIDNAIKETNTGVKAYVTENKVPFNTNQLKSQLNQGKDELKLVFASDRQAEKTYDAVVKEFMKHVKSKDTAGLFEARQAFDKIPAIKKLLESQGLGENVKKEIVLTVRGNANRYVANLLPKGNQFRNTLLKESRMIEALSNIAEKNTDLIGTNKLQALTKKYPVLKAITGGVGAGLGLGAIGVGSSIIGSTD